MSERAFPSAAIDDKFGGMTLLDYFAGQALAGIIAEGGVADGYHQVDAQRAYDSADAMMAERAKRNVG